MKKLLYIIALSLLFSNIFFAQVAPQDSNFLEQQYNNVKKDIDLVRRCYFKKSPTCNATERIEAPKAAGRIIAKGVGLVALLATIGTAVGFGIYKFHKRGDSKPQEKLSPEERAARINIQQMIQDKFPAAQVRVEPRSVVITISPSEYSEDDMRAMLDAVHLKYNNINWFRMIDKKGARGAVYLLGGGKKKEARIQPVTGIEKVKEFVEGALGQGSVLVSKRGNMIVIDLPSTASPEAVKTVFGWDIKEVLGARVEKWFHTDDINIVINHYHQDYEKLVKDPYLAPWRIRQYYQDDKGSKRQMSTHLTLGSPK